MDLSDPFEALVPGAESAVLGVLATAAEYRSGSEIARLAGRSHPTAIKALKRFAEQGLVDSVESGRSTLYQMNREHLAARPILELVSLRQTFFDRLSTEIETWEIQPESVTVFGSVARADGESSSDIDLLVVRKDETGEEDQIWQEELYKLRRLVYRWTGNHLAVIELNARDIGLMVRQSSPFYENVKRDGIHIFGTRFTRLSPFA